MKKPGKKIKKKIYEKELLKIQTKLVGVWARMGLNKGLKVVIVMKGEMPLEKRLIKTNYRKIKSSLLPGLSLWVCPQIGKQSQW